MKYKNKSAIGKIIIKKVFGKYDYEFNIENSINIFIDDNGVGKTTVLSIISNFLKSDFDELEQINFESIEIICQNTKRIKYEKEEPKKELNEEQKYMLYRLLRRIDRETGTNTYLNFREKTIKNLIADIETVIFEIPNLRGRERVVEEYKEILSLGQSEDRRKELKNLEAKIKSYVQHTVFYFPTYRRIEKNYLEVYNRETLFFKNNEIKFGMNDIKSYLKNIIKKMNQEMFEEYKTMNNRVFEELLDFDIEEERLQDFFIEEEKIENLIKKINTIGMEDTLLKKVKEKLKNIENEFETVFFKSYISKLIRIYDKQKKVEDKIKEYVEICNKYFHHKKMLYNENDNEIVIKNDFDEKIDFEYLSSGEKQIVALLTKVYLTEKNNIIFIIDEPELSLSIAWQEELLKDLYASNNISLLIAATHSPFIFEKYYFDYTNNLANYIGRK